MTANSQNESRDPTHSRRSAQRRGLRYLGYALVALAGLFFIGYPSMLRDPEVAASEDRILAELGVPVLIIVFGAVGLALISKHRVKSFRPRAWVISGVLVVVLTVVAATIPHYQVDKQFVATESTEANHSTSTTSALPMSTLQSSTIPSSSPSVDAPRLTFNPSMVRAHGVTKQHKGGQSNVRFVAGTTNIDDIKRLAIDCVNEFTKETKAAFCYAYATQSDYDLKDPEWTPEFDESIWGGYRICWIFQAGQALADSFPNIVAANTSATYDLMTHCPGGVMIPD